MTKNDFRVQFPLWNIALWMILMFWSFGIVYAVDILAEGVDSIYAIVDGELTIKWHYPALFSMIVGLLLLIAFFIAYFRRLNKHNRENPALKISAFSFFKPGEFLEDDELLSQVTENAAKKVYVLYSQALPLIIFFIMIFPFNRYAYIVIMLLMLIVHNALYYREFRLFFSDDYQLESAGNMRSNWLRMIFPVILTVIILISIAIPSYQIVQGGKDQQEKLQQFESCLDTGKSATMEIAQNGKTIVTCQ
ncbi:hypothetical protein PZE06_18600 [Robertmurraya sp. DFI.2.37]|uniref:hypothetical protein n=1 Tax=Robertmurraya sp. DFI.2.37 TaxID=3031819 RepID=UPI0023DA3390|nr:hypothetical protein [Robertmurraya sp. DFI.2.37]MDF1510147.1 hypothetical protein [Robertmurraya sp. DFI.2.37]